MKKSLSQKEVILIMAITFAIIGLVYFMGTRPGNKAVEIEARIDALRASVDGSMPSSFPKAKDNTKTSE